MKLRIRQDDTNKTEVIVEDIKTGYAVASFYCQAGKDGKALFSAKGMARIFVKVIENFIGEKWKVQ